MAGRKSMPEVERFLSHVDKSDHSGCWLWTACRLPSGYGQFRLPQTHELAHRASHRLFVGPVAPGMEVMHACDNPPCVNPAHLSVGTRRDNVRDCHSKGRESRGEAHTSTKLTDLEVVAIRKSSLYQRELAQRFGVSQSHIARIKSGKARAILSLWGVSSGQ